MVACAVNGSTLTSCTTATTVPGPSLEPGAAIGISIYSGFAYITDISTHSIVSCSVNGSTFTGCIEITNPLFGLPAAIQVRNNIAYITDGINNTVISCKVNNGALTDCINSGASSLLTPIGLALFDQQ